MTLLNYRMRTHYKSGEFLGPRIGDKIFSGVLILSLYWGIGDEKVTLGPTLALTLTKSPTLTLTLTLILTLTPNP